MKVLSFTRGNYDVCTYCKYRLLAQDIEDWKEGCSVNIKPDGKFARISMGGLDYIEGRTQVFGEEYINMRKGCDKFESSGLPVHPQAYPHLIQQNSLAQSIPVDKNALETSWEFELKRRKFIPQNSYNKLPEEIE